ncbi:MAG: TPR repeat protein [Verrucomicrobiales bacterium]|jgi:TPR repeat protein
MNKSFFTARMIRTLLLSLIAFGYFGLLPLEAQQDWLATPIIGAIKNPSAKVEKALSLLKSQRYDLAVQILRDAVSEDRDPDAQYLMGWCYANGKGVTRSLLQAEQSFFGAAQRKREAAQYSLGRLRIETAQPGSTKRVDSGIESLKAAADQGMGGAMRMLGLLHKNGIPGALDPSPAEAMRWFEKAGGAGDAESLYYQGVLMEGGDMGEANPTRALTFYNQAAANGSSSAMLHLGALAMKKKSTPDRVTAIGWYEKAAALNSAEARHRLGLLLRDSDPRKAFEHFRIAADQGYSPAQADFGIALEEGVGTNKDISQAVKAYQQAAAGGNPVGLFRLGNCYENGFGIGKDQTKAAENFQKSGQAGYAEAQHRMGIRYVSGQGVVKDQVAAAAWLKLGATQGYAPCQRDLAEIYETSLGEMRNPARALELYQKAAMQGDAGAWFRLGRMVEKGDGVPVDLERAYQLYYGASEKGDSDARSSAESVARRLTTAVVERVEARYTAMPDKVPASSGGG